MAQRSAQLPPAKTAFSDWSRRCRQDGSFRLAEPLPGDGGWRLATGAMSARTLPLLFLNLGGEMLYILDQRLRAQSIPGEKARKGERPRSRPRRAPAARVGSVGRGPGRGPRVGPGSSGP